ncbi:MAG: sulfatase, partial [Candidatus Aminicenantes bacterium]|nr:sulfatase [Candidatus Aminicenantes bacterium]
MKRALPASALVLASFLGLPALPVRAGAAELNILLVTIDTLRPDRLSCYSPKHLETPRIDALAAKGVLFERAFAHDPITLASHANILLGMTSLAHGVSENSLSVVSPDYLTLAELLKGRGYATGAFVSAFPLDSRFGLDQGFDVYDDSYPAKPTSQGLFSERPAEKTITAALKWLSDRKGPWFCWIHLWDPHAPYAAPEPYASRFKDKPYIGEVAYVDAEVGRLLDELGRQGTIGQTVVALTADHGESLGEHGEMTHGYFAYNSTLWVP